MTISERPTVRHLECVVAVAEHASFRRAAHALGISQPALSEHIRTLERLLALQLFERDRRQVLITPAGADTIARAREALAAVDGVRDAARRRSEPLVGRLRLGVIPTIAPYWLPRVLPAVRRAFSKLELVLREDHTSRLLGQLHDGELDAALLSLPVPGDFTAAEIARESFVVAAPRHTALGRRRSKLADADLEDQTVLLLEDGH